MTRCALYLRVSSNTQTVDNQLPALEAYCQARGYEVAGIYQEAETAWKSGHQVELARLMHDCRNGRSHPDIVLAWSLDRLSREGSAAILNLVNTFKLYGVKVISLQESWTEAPGELGEILFAIAGWVARMESQRRSERTKAGLERVRQHGSKSGRGIGKRGTDKGKRKSTGYLLRYANRGAVTGKAKSSVMGLENK